MATFEITALWIYPVKSLGGFSVPRATITPGGSFTGDREWLVVDPTGHMLWQGNISRMTLLKATLDDATLTITQPDGTLMTLGTNHGGNPSTVTQYGVSFDGIDAGDATANWLSAFLGQPCRLVRIGHKAHLWPKLNPLHLISLQSLAILDQRMHAIGGPSIEIERLRPNIVVDGDHAPFAEETVPSLHFGDTEIRLNEPCIRCILPNISRFDAAIQKQPLKLIGTMSKERPTSKPASFGIYSHATGTSLKLGMSASA